MDAVANREISSVRVGQFALVAATFAFVFIGAALISPMNALAQNAREPRIRVQTDLVTVPASVLDANGKPVADLPESAFRLTENGVPQKIAKFETETDRPLELVLMVDSSLSTLKDTRFEDQAAARFIRLVVHPQDLLSVFERSEERRVGKECRSRGEPLH